MRSTLVKEKMRSFITSGQRVRSSNRANVRGRSAVCEAIEKMEKRVLFAAFTPGDIVVEQYGNSTTTLTNGATAIVLDEFSPTGTLVQQITLPTTAGTGSTPNALTGVGSSGAEGFLTLTSDGHYLVVPGYSAAAGTVPALGNTTTTGAYTITNVSGGTTTIITTPSTTGGASTLATTAPYTAVTIAGNSEVTAGTTYYAKQLTTSTAQLFNDSAGTMALSSTAGIVAGGTLNSTPVLREVGRVDPSGAIDTTTTLGTGTLSAFNVRGAASVNGSTGIYYDGSATTSNTSIGVVNFGGATAPTYLGSQNSRAEAIFNGDLFISTASGTVGIDEVGPANSGLPTTASTPPVTNILNTNASTNTAMNAASPYGFFFATLNGGSSPDTLYVEDSTKGLFKYTGSIGGSWTLNSVTNASGNSLAGTGLTASVSGSTVTLYITTTTSVEKLVDASGYNAAVTASAVPIATIATGYTTGEAFRGVAFVPQPLGAPMVATQPPTTTNVYVGSTATITSLAYGVGVTDQWQVSTNGGTSFTNITDGTLYSGTMTTTLSVLSATLSENGYEYREAFTNASGGPVYSNASTLAVTNAPEFNFNASTYTVNENVTGGVETITVVRGGDTSGAVSVGYNTSNGTAIAGTNYNSVSGTLSYAVGATTATFNVPIDAVVPQGGNKTFNVNLFSPSSGAALGTPSTAVVTIVDTQEVFNLSSGSYVVNDTDTTGVVSIIRTGTNITDTATIGVTISGAFSATSIVSFSANQVVGAATFSIPTNSTGANESITVTIGNANASAGLASLGTTSSATDTIVHNVSGASSVTTAATSTGDIETSGYYGSSYAPINGDVLAGTGTFSYLAYEVLEFSTTTTPSIYPAPGTTVNTNGVSNLSLQLFNTDATSGDNYNGHDGNFNVYFIADTDASTATSGLVYNTSAATTGLDPNQFKSAPVLVGTFTFSDVASYDTYTAASIPSSVESALVADLNSGASFRFALTPEVTGKGSIAADLKGITAGQSPILSFNAAETTTKTLETINFSSGSYTESEAGPNTTITLTRSGTNISDTATVTYTASNGSGVAGTNYTATSGTATFAAGSATTSFVVPALNASPQGGDKTVNLTLSAPATGGSTTTAILGTQSTATLTITDVSTAPTETIAPTVVGSANVEVKSIYDDTEFKAGGTSAAYASFGTLDLSDSGVGPTNPITAIDSFTLTIKNVPSTVSALSAGPVDFYLATTNTTLTLGATSPYYNSSNGIEGVGTQLGSLQFLGSFNLTDVNPGDTQTISLNGFNSSTENTLISDLNNSTSFRLVITPESVGVNADFDPGTAVVAIKAQEGVVVTIPPWLSSNSVVTSYTAGSAITISSGTIIANPNSTGDGSIAVTDTGTLQTNLSGGVTAIQIGSMNISSGATFSLRATSSTLSTDVPILVTSGLSISSTGVLDAANGDIDLVGGSSGTLYAYVKTGFANGAWNGVGGIDSTVAAVNHLNALGVRPATASGTLDGYGYASTDALLKYTYFGDADLSGKVDGSDYSRIDSASLAGSTATGWYNGDFNYDGVINGSDYTLIDNAFNTQGATISAVVAPAAKLTAVPPVAATPDSSIFSNKKVKESYIDLVMADLVTG